MERKVTIKKGHNLLNVITTKAKSIEIIDSTNQVVASSTAENLADSELFYLQPGRYRIVTDGKIKKTTTASEKLPEKLEYANLVLTSDAKDYHLVDGIGEIPADGSSFAKISVQKIDQMGKSLSRIKDNDTLYLRTTAGVLMDSRGQKGLRSLKLRKGKASFRLYSEESKKLASIQVFCLDPMLEDSSINIEFV